MDWCSGDIRQEDQFIVIMDNAAPIVTCQAEVVLQSNVYECEAPYIIEPATVTDACSENATYSIYLEDGSEAQVGDVITVYGSTSISYVAVDDCGNGSDTCTTMVYVADNTLPVAVCDQNTVVSIGTDGLGLVCAETVDDGSYDNCVDDLIFKVRRMDAGTSTGILFTDCVEFDCSDVGQDIVVVFRVYDAPSSNYRWNNAIKT